MASTHKHLRSSTANKRPTTAIAEGQIALNTNSASPGLFFKDSTGASIIKVGPVHVGTTAPNVTPPSGGSSGNSTGEVWLDTSLTPAGVKIWNGSAWVNATPVGSTTVQGLLELATNAETQAGTDVDRAVTPAALQSKVSDSTTTSSSTTIASSTAVKTAYDLANAALPRSGGTITGNLEIGTTGSLSFEGSTADAFETTIAVTDPTADRTITLPDTTGTVVTTGDTGTVTSTMIADGTIVNADINASAAIAHSKLANITAGSVLLGNASNVPTATALSGDVTVTSSGVTAISSGVIVNADVNASAAIAGTKISPDFGSQNVTTTGTSTAASFIPTSSTVPANGLYLSGTNTVALSTASTGRLFVDASGRLGLGVSSPGYILDVASTSEGIIRLKGGSGASQGAGFWIQEAGSTSTLCGFGDRARFYGGTPDQLVSLASRTVPLTFDVNGSERMRLDSSGRLGLGTSSPGAALDVSGNGNLVRFGDGTNTFDVRFKGPNNWDVQLDTSADKFNIRRNSSSLVTVDGAGRVGIGTATPAATLHSRSDNAGSGSTPILIQNRSVSANTAVGISFAPNTSDTADRSAIIYGVNSSGGTGNATDLTFHTNANGGSPSEKVRIDSSGRLLVGTSTARSTANTSNTALIQIESTGTYAAQSIVSNSNDATGSYLVLGKSRGTTVSSNTIVSSGDYLGLISFDGADGTGQKSAAFIHAQVDGTPGANDMPGRLVFSTTADGASSPTERMRIRSNGVISTFNSVGDSLNLYNASSAGASNAFIYGLHSATNNVSGGTTSFIVYTNGNVVNTNNSYGAISDLKLKENIVDATSQWSDIKALQVRKYNFKEGQTHTQIGLIAQEVELVSPGLVSESPDRDAEGNDLGTVTKSVNYSVLYMKAVKALQEAMERIETLEAKVAALEAA